MGALSYWQILKKKGFIYFIYAEFFGALNDNVLRMVLGFQALEVGWTGGETSSVSALGVSAVGAVFIVPFLIFSGIAGNIADTFNKQRVLFITKALEVATMILSIFVIPLNIFWLSLAVLFLDATKTTFFSPAEYGYLPEIFNEKALTRANSLVSLATYSAIIVGLFIGSSLYYLFKDHKVYISLFIFGISLLGWAAVFFIPRSPHEGTGTKVSFNLYQTIISGTQKILADSRLVLTVGGIIWFWFTGGMIQILLMLMGKEDMHLNSFFIGTIFIYLGIGVAVGNLLCGRLSGDHINLGLSVIGGIGMGLSGMLLFFTASSYAASIVPLFLLGLAGGIFIVPLNANLQYLAGVQEKGKLVATSNVYSMAAVLAASVVIPFFYDLLALSSDQILFILGIATLGVVIYPIFKTFLSLKMDLRFGAL